MTFDALLGAPDVRGIGNQNSPMCGVLPICSYAGALKTARCAHGYKQWDLTSYSLQSMRWHHLFIQKASTGGTKIKIGQLIFFLFFSSGLHASCLVFSFQQILPEVSSSRLLMLLISMPDWFMALASFLFITFFLFLLFWSVSRRSSFSSSNFVPIRKSCKNVSRACSSGSWTDLKSHRNNFTFLNFRQIHFFSFQKSSTL